MYFFLCIVFRFTFLSLSSVQRREIVLGKDHRTRYRQKQRAEGKRRSKRYRPSRKSGQQRGRPPNSVQQQTSQSSVQRREIVLGKAHHIPRELSSRGNSIGKALHLNNSVSSCRGNDIGKALTDSIVSSSRGELEELIEELSSMCSSTSVNGDPSLPSSSSSLVEPSSLTFSSSPLSGSDASSSTSVVDSLSSSTRVSHLSVANKSESSPPLDVLHSPSSHKSVDTLPPSSTTFLVASLPSSSAITDEITDRRQQLNYLQALLGTAPNIG